MFDFGKRTIHDGTDVGMRRPDRFMGTARRNMPEKSAVTSSSGGIQGHLDKLQQILTVVERTTPYIEEYGPVVKNIPQMYRMIKAFKSIDFDEDSSNETAAQAEQSVSHEPAPHDVAGSGISKPKLFI